MVYRIFVEKKAELAVVQTELEAKRDQTDKLLVELNALGEEYEAYIEQQEKEMYELCEKWGIVLVQAHPYRQSPCNPQYMHGVEINCNSADLDKAPLVEELAKTHDLLITCGTDDHSLQNEYRGGIFVPASCHTSADVAKYFRVQKEVKIFQEEVEKVYKYGTFSGK
jgi:hypothetical protein